MTAPSSQDRAASDLARKPVDWVHYVIVVVVFGVTGLLSMLFSRFLLGDILHLEGGVWSGPWSYRIAYLALVPPSYSVTLVVVGTLAGKHLYFRRRVLGTWRLLLPKSLRGTGWKTASGGVKGGQP